MASSLKNRMAANAAIRDNGLGSLLGNAVAQNMDDKDIREIPLEKLHPFSAHTFKVIRNEDYASVVDSIKDHGVIIPLVVRPHPTIQGDYEIIAGHRRCTASRDAGLSTVPCLILKIGDAEARKDMIESNIQRPEWLPSEKARSYKLWMDTIREESGIRAGRPTGGEDGDISAIRASEVACKRFGVSARTLDMYVKLNDCSEEILSLCDDGRLTVTAAYQLAFLTDDQQHDVAQELKAKPDVTMNESDAKAIRWKYEGRSVEKPSSPSTNQTSEPVPDEIEKTELTSSGYVRGDEPSASHPTHKDSPVTTSAPDKRVNSNTPDESGAGRTSSAEPVAATGKTYEREKARLCWDTIDGRPDTPISNGVCITVRFEHIGLGPDEAQNRMILDKVLQGNNHVLHNRIRAVIAQELQNYIAHS